MRQTGSCEVSTTLGEEVRAFVPHPAAMRAGLVVSCFEAANRAAEMALAWLAGVSGLVPSVDWLLYGAVRKEALADLAN